MKRDSEKISTALLDSTVFVIANEGLVYASTRKIASVCNLPDAYIYQYFQSKDDLIAKAFSREDKRFANAVKRKLKQLSHLSIDAESKRYLLFEYVWDCFVTNSDARKFYLQYYHSPHFKKYSEEKHESLWDPILKDIGEMCDFGDISKFVLHNLFYIGSTLTNPFLRKNLL